MFGWTSRREKLLEEFENHLEIETQENIDAGMPPEEARHAAMRKFGNMLVAAETSRRVWGGVWLERLQQDLRYALRSLIRYPAYSVTLIVTLVLGLGCVIAMLAIVESVLMRPVALPHSSRLVQIYEGEPQGTYASSRAISYRELEDMRRGTQSFTGLSGFNTMVIPVGAADGARVTELVEATPDLFATLGIQPGHGRLFGPGDEKKSLIVINDEFWRERLHADPRAIGSTVKVSGKARTVIGILPAGLHFPQGTGGPAAYLPISLSPAGEDEFTYESASIIARLKPGISMHQALADAQTVFAHAGPTDAISGARPKTALVMVSYRDSITGDMRRPLLAILGGVIVLLLIACANAANLQIGRAAGRVSEMRVRSALGAGFSRLLQQLAVESLLVSLFCAALGGALAFAAVAVVRHAYGSFPRFDEIAVRPAVLAAAALLAILVGVASSLAPALSIRRQATGAFNTRSVTRSSPLPGILVALQVALTCVLLVAAGLFIRTLRSLENVRLGFDPHNVTTLVLMAENQRQDTELSRQIETRLLHRLEALPGVQSVAMQTEVPFSSYNMSLNGTTEVVGRAYHDGDSAFYSLVSTGFVRASGIHLLKGRGFLPGDEDSGNVVVLVNQAFVEKYLHGRDPVEANLRFHRDRGETDADIPFAHPMTVIGVVENEMQGRDLAAAHEPMVYLNYLQLPKESMLSLVFNMTAQYAVRSTLAPAALAAEMRAAVRQEAPGMVEMSLGSMENGISESLGQRRLALRLVAGFGMVALILSAVGIYGVLAWSVALRRREIGVRMALGSSRAGVARLILRRAGTMVFFGLIPGIAGAWAAGHAIRSYLYGVRTLDPITLLAVGLLLLLVSVAAAALPALRAAHVDPVETLRAE